MLDAMIMAGIALVVFYFLYRLSFDSNQQLKEKITKSFLSQLSSPLLVGKIFFADQLTYDKEYIVLEDEKRAKVFYGNQPLPIRLAHYHIDPKSISVEFHYNFLGKASGNVTAHYKRVVMYPGHEQVFLQIQHAYEKSLEQKRSYNVTISSLFSPDARQFASFADEIQEVSFPFQLSMFGVPKFGRSDIRAVSDGRIPMISLVIGCDPIGKGNEIRYPVRILSPGKM